MSYEGSLGGGSAPSSATFLVVSLNAALTAERALVAGAGLASVDGGAGGNFTVNVGAGTGITANANDVALDTASTRNTDHAAVTLTAGTGLSGGGDITTNRTFNLANTAVTPATYGDATSVAVFTVDQQGRITSAITTPITFPTPAPSYVNQLMLMGG